MKLKFSITALIVSLLISASACERVYSGEGQVYAIDKRTDECIYTLKVELNLTMEQNRSYNYLSFRGGCDKFAIGDTVMLAKKEL